MTDAIVEDPDGIYRECEIAPKADDTYYWWNPDIPIMTSPVKRMNKKRKMRLFRLRDLLRLVDESNFNMASYQEFDYRSTDSLCCTSACAGGWAPRLGYERKEGEAWVEYLRRVFLPTDTKYIMPSYRWIFGMGWHTQDNTPLGAAIRIDIFLKVGIPRLSNTEYQNGKFYQPTEKGHNAYHVIGNEHPPGAFPHEKTNMPPYAKVGFMQETHKVDVLSTYLP